MEGQQSTVSAPQMSPQAPATAGEELEMGTYGNSIEAPENSLSESNEKTDIELNQDKDLMSIPGTAHDKLVYLAEYQENQDANSPKELDNQNDEKTENVNSDETGSKELSFEQQVIMVQNEVINFLLKQAGKEGGNKQEEDPEKLLKKLKKLLEELQQNKNQSEKPSMVNILLSLIITLMGAAAKGINTVEKTAKGDL